MASWWEGKRRLGNYQTEDSTVIERVDQPSSTAQGVASAPKPVADRPGALLTEEQIAEYGEVAAEIGVSSADIAIEKFKLFLTKHDIPIFKLAEVIAYMDEAAARDNPAGYGWNWCPVREKDTSVRLQFGRRSVRDDRALMLPQGRFGPDGKPTKVPASDFYESHIYYRVPDHIEGGRIVNVDRSTTSDAYSRTIPLHAMKKIAIIERNFGANVIFLISDYAMQPHSIVGPDPFLMAVIPNTAVEQGKGRFVIDVWDEPGFGIDRMIK